MQDNNEKFEYSKESSKSPFLGKLTGVCADIVNATRNGRKYSQELWEKVFKDPIVIEQLENGGIIGEAMHPVDREETDIEKAAIIMKEKPEMRNGKLWATFHILDTPCGRILKTLCDAGVTIGVSSRGTGDVVTDIDGNESVDPDSYDFKCFDAVCIPAVKEARMQFVTEGLQKKINLKESLNKLIESECDDKNKKLIIETLKDLKLYESEDNNISEDDLLSFVNSMKEESLEEDIVKDNIDSYDPLDDDLNESSDENIVNNKEDNNQQQSADYYREDSEDEEVGNSNSDIISELQKLFKIREDLENKVLELQEKLSACYTKEAKLKQNVLTVTKALNEANKKISGNDSLSEKLEIANKENTIKDNKIRELSSKLNESINLNR